MPASKILTTKTLLPYFEFPFLSIKYTFARRKFENEGFPRHLSRFIRDRHRDSNDDLPVKIDGFALKWLSLGIVRTAHFILDP